MVPHRSSRLVALLLLASCGPYPGTGEPAPVPASPAAPAARHPVSPAPLEGLVEDVARFAGLDNVARADTLLAVLGARGLHPEVQRFPNLAVQREPRPEGRNLVVTLGEGARDLVVGAHFDAARLPDGRLVEGVVDNGAGAVVLTRVAETLRGHRLRHRVRVVLFDLEEVGLLGSRAYLQAEEPGRVAAMVNVDIAAYGNTLIYGPTVHPGNDAVYRGLGLVCAVQRIPCVEFPQYPPSDDRSFQRADVPNVSIGILPAVEAHQMWLLVNGGGESGLADGFVPRVLRTIHTPADRLELADAAAMTRVHDAVVALVLELDATIR
jgi:hypothetical protein